MSYLVDTNVLSEPARREPQPGVVTWLREYESELYVSALSIGEVRRGIERLSGGRRKTQLRVWLQSLCACMKGRILSFNASTAHVWGQLKADWDKKGIAISSMDSLIAASAHRYNLTLVTRNTSDFEGTGVKLHNPFEN